MSSLVAEIQLWTVLVQPQHCLVLKVSVVYRRNKRNMPADEEELYLALEDGVDFLELLSPIKHENQQLTCEKWS